MAKINKEKFSQFAISLFLRSSILAKIIHTSAKNDKKIISNIIFIF